MTEATVNSSKFTIVEDDDKFIIDGKELNLDILPTGKSTFHVINKSISYNAHLIKIDAASKTATIKINNNLFDVSLKSELDLLLGKMGLESGNKQTNNSIVAPMPGLIVNVVVNVGDQVKKGETLLILEAMKMENAIKSPKDGVISLISIEGGESVEKNQTLIEF